jgi:hypothetical protein
MILAISSQLLSLFISFDFFSIKIGVSLFYFLFRRFVKSWNVSSCVWLLILTWSIKSDRYIENMFRLKWPVFPPFLTISTWGIKWLGQFPLRFRVEYYYGVTTLRMNFIQRISLSVLRKEIAKTWVGVYYESSVCVCGKAKGRGSKCDTDGIDRAFTFRTDSNRKFQLGCVGRGRKRDLLKTLAICRLCIDNSVWPHRPHRTKSQLLTRLLLHSNLKSVIHMSYPP